MSRGSLLFGTGGGKLGNMVLFRAGGQERQRAYLRKIANPKTDAQVAQRMRFSIAGSAYKALKKASQKLSYSSFLSTPYSSFIKANVALSPYLQKGYVDDMELKGYAPSAPWAIANGNLITPIFLMNPKTIDNQPNNIVITYEARVSFADTLAYFTDVNPHSVGQDITDASVWLDLFWRAFGLSPNLHICSYVGSTTVLPINGKSNTYYGFYSKHHLMREIWPYSPNVTTEYTFLGESIAPPQLQASGAINYPTTNGIVVSGDVYTVDSRKYAPVEVHLETNTIENVNIISLVFTDEKGPSVSNETSNEPVWAFWVADGVTKNTSYGTLKFQNSRVYQNLRTDVALASAIPTWRSGSESSNSNVYNV